MACRIVVEHFYFISKDRKLGVIARSSETKSITFNIVDLPVEAKIILDKYQRKMV